MQKTVFTSIQVSQNKSFYLDGITSLTISNYGNSNLRIIIAGVMRIIPAFKAEIGVPFGAFNLPGDGTECNIDFALEFDAGTVNNAILDYRAIKKTC